jgi:glycosyltransferase involved in cell wall biosynthesis
MRCPTLADLRPPPPGKTGWPWTVESPQLPDTMSDGRPWPRICIVTPSYNQGQFIEETIRSVLLQGYPGLEYIIVDGGSTDNSVEIIKKYEPWLSYWVSEKDRGQSHAINKGFRQGSAPFGNWLNSDDVLFPAAIATIGQSIADAPGASYLVGKSEYRDKTGKVVWHHVNVVPTDLDHLLLYFDGVFVPQPSCFFDIELFWRAGGLDERLHYAMDLDLWIKLVSLSPARSIDAVCSWMRSHEDAKTFKLQYRVTSEVENILMAWTRQRIARIRRSAAIRRSGTALEEAKRQFRRHVYLKAFVNVTKSLLFHPAQAKTISAAAWSKYRSFDVRRMTFRN